MNATGIIFANVDDYRLPELTQRRAISSVPFGGRFRLVDFALSNMVNSGISNVGLITNSNYQSLVDHIGGGKDWDLARRSGGLRILPPFGTAGNSSGHVTRTRLESLIDNIAFIRRQRDDYFVLTDGCCICNMDYDEMVKKHAASGNDVSLITRVVREPSREPGMDGSYRIESDENGRVVEITDYQGEQNIVQVGCHITILSKQMLLTLLARAMAHGLTGLYHDLLRPQLNTLRIGVLRFDGYYARFNSLTEYYGGSLALLRPEVRAALFEIKNRPILTKVRNMSPTLYGTSSSVKNTLVADGCQIDGVVENCILFRGVHIGAGAEVRNCILMQDTYIAPGAKLNCVVTDKNVVVRDDRLLSGHETMPFFICKAQIV